MSASHDDSSRRTQLTGNVNKVHLYLGSAKWEAGDFAGYFDDGGTFIKKSKTPFPNTYADFVGDADHTRSSDHSANDGLILGLVSPRLSSLPAPEDAPI